MCRKKILCTMLTALACCSGRVLGEAIYADRINLCNMSNFSAAAIGMFFLLGWGEVVTGKL